MDENLDGPVRLLNLFRVRDELVAAAESMLDELVARARDDAACRAIDVLRDVEQPNAFAVLVDFASRDDLHSYLDADWRQQVLRGLPELLDGPLQRHVMSPVQ